MDYCRGVLIAISTVLALACSPTVERVSQDVENLPPDPPPPARGETPEHTNGLRTDLCCGIPGRRGCIVSLMQLMHDPDRFAGHVVDTGGYLTKVSNEWELTMGPLPPGPRPRGTGIFLRFEQPEVRDEIEKIPGEQSIPVAVVGMFEPGTDTCSAALNGTIVVNYFIMIDPSQESAETAWPRPR